MCMDISKEDLLRINKGFGGNLRSSSSLDFVFGKLENKRLGLYKKIAYLWGAILVDHPFSDGNKRTAAFVAYFLADESGKIVDKDLLTHQIISIAKKNISNIRNIKQRIKTILK